MSSVLSNRTLGHSRIVVTKSNLLTLYVDRESKLVYCPQPDMTPMESANIAMFTIIATQGLDIDFEGSIIELDIERHFSRRKHQ